MHFRIALFLHRQRSSFSKTYPSFLTLKEGSTFHPCPLSSGAREETALLGARNRFALRLADHQRSAPCCAGWDRLDASGNIFYVLDFGGVSEKSGVFRNIDVYNGDDVCNA